MICPGAYFSFVVVCVFHTELQRFAPSFSLFTRRRASIFYRCYSITSLPREAESVVISRLFADGREVATAGRLSVVFSLETS